MSAVGSSLISVEALVVALPIGVALPFGLYSWLYRKQRGGKFLSVAGMITLAVLLLLFLGTDLAGRSSHSVTTRQTDTAHDEGVLDDLSRYSRIWNQTTGRLVRDYLDPAVSAESWVRSGEASLHLLQETYLAMSASVLSFQSSELRRFYQPITANYKRKLDAITALRFAVASGNADAELAAQVELQEAAQEGKKLAVQLIDAARDHVDPEFLDKALQESAQAAADALAPD